MIRAVDKPLLLTYSSLPYNGQGPAQSCVNILEHIPPADFSTSLIIPRFTKRPSSSIAVTQALGEPFRRFPWKYIAPLAGGALNNCMVRAIDAADPETTILYFWPDHDTSLLKRAKARGLLTIREMINSYRGTAKAILDTAYNFQNMEPRHGITDESVCIEREQLALYDYIFASSQVEATLFEAGVDPSRILPTAFGWDPRRFSMRRPSEPAGLFQALFVGTLSIRKGVMQLLEAWKKSGVNGKLKLAGSVSPELGVLIRPYLADDSIEFLGFQENVGDLYSSSDLFIFPSFEEGGPQVVYEAAGCGLPIIATPMGGGRIVRDGVNGLIVQPNDVDSLAAAIRSMAESPAKRQLYGRQGAADAARYTYERIGEDRSRMLLDVLNIHRSSSRFSSGKGQALRA